MPRALISGVSGFVGSHLAEYLVDNTDWEIIGMCRWRSPLDNIQSLIPEINKGGRVRLVYADLRDGIAVREAVEQANPHTSFIWRRRVIPRPALHLHWTRLIQTHRGRCVCSMRYESLMRKYMFAHRVKCTGEPRKPRSRRMRRFTQRVLMRYRRLEPT